MSHIVFFSYARKDLDPYLEDFFKDLCWEISLLTNYSPEDEELSFRDKSSLPIMENWKTNIVGALQSSAVLVCITSVKFFKKEFCGKEYYVFDQRRRQGLLAGKNPPPVVLPVIWLPAGDLPDSMNEVQQVPKDVSDAYLQRGLRDLARFDRGLYDRCVTAFARAIVDAWKEYAKKIKALDNVPDFENVPNAFAEGKWEEAVGPGGAWLPGPEVANFVFVAESKDECPIPEGRYGTNSSDWRPYFPTEPDTILEHATKAAKKQFRFREIRVNDDLPGELEHAKKRKNLSIVIGDPKALNGFKAAQSIEQLWWEGLALFLPCHEAVIKDDQKTTLKTAFPIISQILSPNVRSPGTPAELQAALDLTLSEMRKAVTQPEIDSRDKSGDPPPPGLSGSGGPRT
jgi:hypothetical protein